MNEACSHCIDNAGTRLFFFLKNMNKKALLYFLPEKLAKGMQDFVSLQKTGYARQDEKSRKSRRRRQRWQVDKKGDRDQTL